MKSLFFLAIAITACVCACTNYSVTATTLNVRSGPGTKYKVVSTLKKGATVCVTSVSNGWAKFGTGKYCSASYLQKQSSTSASTSSCTNKCATTSVNMRAGPSTSNKIVKTISTGTKVCVVSTSNGWSKLNNGNYISSKYLGSCSSTSSSGNTSGGSATSTADEKTIWNFLYGKIGNKYGTAGLMGNLKAESNLQPTNLQNSYEKSLGYSDSSYTAAVDNGKYKNFVHDSAGYGLAQWTYYTRKQNLLNYAKSKNASIGNLTMQLEFLWKELTGSYSSVVSSLKSAKSVAAASNAVLLKFEKPKDQSTSVQNKRASLGQEFYNKFK